MPKGSSSVNMQEVKCLNCLQVQRVEYDTVSVSSDIPKHCSYCGSPRILRKKVDAYWYDLAESLGYERSNEGAELIKGLFDLWPREDFAHFRDFVESMEKELENADAD